MHIKNKPDYSFLLLFLAISVILSLSAWYTLKNSEQQLRAELGEALTTVLDTTQQALKIWETSEQNEAMIWANRRKIRDITSNLLEIPNDRGSLLNAPDQLALREWFIPIISQKNYQGYFIINSDNISIASLHDENIGTYNLLLQQTDFIDKIWAGNPAISLPLLSDISLADEQGIMRDNLPTMFVGAPIFDERNKVIAAFAFRINPHLAFTSILQQGRMGNSGETYAFNRDGLMISQSRFDEQLQGIGLLNKNQKGILNIHIRDPGTNLLRGNNTIPPVAEQQLTYMAQQALVGVSGFDIDGYRDYRGALVLGAWVWDSELNIGITTEIDVDEAMKPLFYIQNAVIAFTIISILLLALLTLLFILDRNQLEKSEKQRSNLQKQLFHNQKMETVGLLTGGVAHNFNNILAIITGYTQLAQDEAILSSNEKLNTYLGSVMKSSNRANTLIKQMLAFSNKTSLELEPQLLHEFVLDSTKTLLSAVSPDITLIFKIENTDAMVKLDAIELRQVLVNICINAAEAMNDEGEIEIRVNETTETIEECHSCLRPITGKNVILEVKDSGRGIKVQNLHQLFDPFHSTKEQFEGAGMGLSVVHGIMHQHNGHIQVLSKPDFGTTIRLYLPVC